LLLSLIFSRTRPSVEPDIANYPSTYVTLTAKGEIMKGTTTYVRTYGRVFTVRNHCGRVFTVWNHYGRVFTVWNHYGSVRTYSLCEPKTKSKTKSKTTSKSKLENEFEHEIENENKEIEKKFENEN